MSVVRDPWFQMFGLLALVSAGLVAWNEVRCEAYSTGTCTPRPPTPPDSTSLGGLRLRPNTTSTRTPGTGLVPAGTPAAGAPQTQWAEVIREGNRPGAPLVLVGASTNGSLAAGDGRLGGGQYVDPYALLGTSEVEITLTSTAFDPWLAVVGPTGVVAWNDDDSAATNRMQTSRIRVTPQPGYRIVVSSYSPNVTGDYQLSIRSLQPATQPLAIRPSTPAAAPAASPRTLRMSPPASASPTTPAGWGQPPHFAVAVNRRNFFHYAGGGSVMTPIPLNGVSGSWTFERDPGFVYLRPVVNYGRATARITTASGATVFIGALRPDTLVLNDGTPGPWTVTVTLPGRSIGLVEFQLVRP